MAISTLNLKSFGLADPNADKMLMWDDSESALAITGDGFAVGSITGATALAVPPDGDDEIAISDGGTLKRINFQRLQSTNAACRMNFSPSGCTYNIDNTKENLACPARFELTAPRLGI